MTDNAVEEKSGRRRREESEDESELTAGKGRATPGRRNKLDEKEEEGNIVTRSVGGIRGYFEDVRGELEKVSWPTREEAIRLTRIVIITLFLSAITMGGISFLFQQYIAFGLTTPIVFVILLVAAVIAALWYFRTQNMPTKGY
jgi:preprotein translocase subunit SecE